MKGRVILITGGARSGKSAYALRLGEARGVKKGSVTIAASSGAKSGTATVKVR